jgi:hypothetical protein
VQARRIENALGSYMYGDLIETRYGVPDLNKLRAHPGVIGVARLISRPAFEPEQITTAVFKADGVHIEAVKGRTSLWYSLPQRRSRYDSDRLWMEVRGAPFCAYDAMRMRRVLPLTAEESLVRWEKLATLARRAPSCQTMTLDGISYRHRITIDGGEAVRWSNPKAGEHSNQLAIIQSYRDIVERSRSDSRMSRIGAKAQRVFESWPFTR